MIEVREELLGDVLLAAPGCPDMTAERALDRATRQFCMDTHAWRYRTDREPLTEGNQQVALELPEGSQIYRPFWVTLGGRKLTGVSDTEVTLYPGTPTGYAFAPDGTLTLDAVPMADVDAEHGIQAEVSLVPKRGRAVLPDQLDPFLMAVEALATHMLLTMPGVEWRDRHGAMDAMAFYQDQVIQARRFGAQRGQHVHRVVRYGGL